MQVILQTNVIDFQLIKELYLFRTYTFYLLGSVKMEKKLALLSFIHRNQFHKLNVGLDLFYRTVTVTGQCAI